jgi:hypothetical protein
VRESSTVRFKNFFCSVCDNIISTRLDALQVVEHGCCDDCVTYWLEPNREKWKEGWRPQGEQLKNYVERISRTLIRNG